MKKLSSRDWAIAVVIFICAFFVGFATKGLFSSPEIMNIENPVNEQLKKSNDSLNALIYYRDTLIKHNEIKEALKDSVIINNNRLLKRQYERIGNFTPEFRARYVDSVLKAAGAR